MIPYRELLDLYERDVAQFIFARTRMFADKQWEAISINQFMRGIVSENYRLGPVDMSERKLLESLKHLKAKQIVEVREGGMTTGNRYRIKEESEIDLEHLHTYVRRHQPKLAERMLGRMAQTPYIRQLVRGRGTQQLSGRLPNNSGVGVPNNSRVHNIPNNNTPNDLLSPEATKGLRRIKIEDIRGKK